MAAPTEFTEPLPIPEVRKPDDIGRDGTHYHRIPMRRALHRFGGGLPPGEVWGYDGVSPGKTIESPPGTRVVAEFLNDLTGDYPFAIPQAGGGHGPHPGFKPDRPWTLVHLHGGLIPPNADGWSDDAFFPGQSATYAYPPQPRAALLWYHDHANMITRLNVYSGFAGLFIARD